MLRIFILTNIIGLFLGSSLSFAQLKIIDRAPFPNAKDAAPRAQIRVQFDRAVNTASITNNIIITGSSSGLIAGSFSFEANNLVVFRPTRSMLVGEKITVTVTTRVTGNDGSRLAQAESWTFIIRALVGSLNNQTRRTYNLRSDSQPSKVITADLNGDSMPEAIVINTNNGIVSIFQNEFKTNNRLNLVREIDLNLAKTSTSSSQGAETISQDVPVLSDILAADLNNNGNPDVIILSQRDSRFYILRNNQNSIASLSTEIFTTGESPTSITSADYNGDGFLDIAISSTSSNQVYVYLNNGTGSFSIPQIYATSRNPSVIQAADMDGDLYTDIAILSAQDKRIDVLKNNGSAQFTIRPYVTQLSFTPSFMIIEPLISANGNRFPDILLGDLNQKDVYLYSNNGNILTPATSFSTTSESRPLYSIVTDIDTDGNFDLVTSHAQSNNIFINKLRSNGTSAGLFSLFPNTITQPSGIAAADITGTSSLDLLVPSVGSRQLNLILNAANASSCDEITTELGIPQIIDFGEIQIGELTYKEFFISNLSTSRFSFSVNVRDTTVFQITTPREFDIPSGVNLRNEVSFFSNNFGTFTTEIVINYSSICGDFQSTIQLRARIVRITPDLEASQFSITTPTNEFILGNSYTFSGVAKSIGIIPVSTPFNVSLSASNQTQQIRRLNTILQPGESVLQDFEVVFNTPGTTTLTYVVDSDKEIDESNEDNNTISVSITVKEGNFKIKPNPFTPNSDGFNDYVRFIFTELFNINNPVVQILNIEGQRIRTLSARDKIGGVIYWDGKDSSGKSMKPGVFLYTVFNDGKLLSRGSITLAL